MHQEASCRFVQVRIFSFTIHRNRATKLAGRQAHVNHFPCREEQNRNQNTSRQIGSKRELDPKIRVSWFRSAVIMFLNQIKINEYGLGSEVSTKGDIYSYGILLLEMMTGKKPTEHMFEDGLDHHSFAKVALPGIVLLEVLTGKRPILEDDLDLHSFARKALPNRVMEIVDPILLKDIEEDSLVGCLISMVRIGVACSMESPQDRMEIRKVIRELNLIRDILQGTQKRPTRKRPMLNLRMTWLPSFEKSYCQDEPNSYSQGESCLPSVENSCSQGGSGLPNFEESYSQGELWLSNFEKSYISSNGQETLSQTPNLFPSPVPSLPKPIQYKGPGWESFEECYWQDEPKSDNEGGTWLPNFENCCNQEEPWLPNSVNSFSLEESWVPI
ncbi:hypothetical protein F0562_026286 [Nyssa sinensis]|uniref:Protein kinase domain-containing protein n=1 Tax=Nyssa sinensis TaxID=561372 RepID=A0A5J5BAC4_9ASTE|nr:hypothetical protein F0562_026286 [Nyssa sinensis]